MNLSNYTGNYVASASVINRQVYTASAGDREFPLYSAADTEEVYKNGSRQNPGPTHDYTVVDGKVRFNTALAADDKIMVIGRLDQSSIPLYKGGTEEFTLSDGQRNITLSSITTDGIKVFVKGADVTSGEIFPTADFEVLSADTIRLTGSYPAGTILQMRQNDRPAWPNPNDMIVNDGEVDMSLSQRFANTQNSFKYFQEKEGSPLVTLRQGAVIASDNMSMPAVVYDGKTWEAFRPSTETITVTSFSVTDGVLTIQGRDGSNVNRTLGYLPRITSKSVNFADINAPVIRDGVNNVKLTNSNTPIKVLATSEFTIAIRHSGGTITPPSDWKFREAPVFTADPGKLEIIRGVRFEDVWLVTQERGFG